MNQVQLKGKKFELFLSEETILKEINRVAKQLNADLKDKEPASIQNLRNIYKVIS
ncbi:MAG: hypothetical protein EZS26_000337 [Candidatus Ordinivivax streblomastigis]|uniref:Uncharacterized protein n=1 Tax=Candidatus Ordinivivax streblomastigis TaxID=2540710 RepID=A0A5M8P689_9BACT|nr:MAG: hypothetical protein EZS26_000337 [Candidatus Ordinivivax streblomastigis]